MSSASALCNVAYNALRRPKKEKRQSHKGAAFGLAEGELLTHARNSRALASPASPIREGCERTRQRDGGEVERGPMNLPRVLRLVSCLRVDYTHRNRTTLTAA